MDGKIVEMDGKMVDSTRPKTFKIVSKLKDQSKDTCVTLENDTEDVDVDTLLDDIEDYLQDSVVSQNSGQLVALPPVIKYNKNWTLSVTDLSSQLWCEKQVEYTLITGRKRVTEEMESGTKRHEELELEDHEIMEVQIETNEDNLGIRLLNTIILLEQLLKTGKCRELWLFGTFGNYTFCGIIDQLAIVEDKVTREKSVVISDTKTRRCKREPSISQMQGSSLQVQMYCTMLEETKNGQLEFDKLHETFKCDRFLEFSAPELKPEGCLDILEKKYIKAFKRLPKISQTMEISYEHEGSVFSTSNVDLKKETLLFTVGHLCDFWDGLRDAEPVEKSEAWKCKICEFRNECSVSPLRSFTEG